MKATQEQVSAMKARLAERMEQRKLEADILKSNVEKTKNGVNIKSAPTADELRRLHN